MSSSGLGLIERSRVAQARPCSLSTEGLRALGLWLGELRGIYEQNYEIVEHERVVYTETYDAWPEGATTVTATFTESMGTTTINVEIEYLTQEARDLAKQPGFEEGFASSYTHLDGILIAMQ